MFKKFGKKKEGDEASDGGDDLASHVATHTTGIPAKGDIAIRPYRKVSKNPRYKKERDAFEARLKLLQMGYKSPHVRRMNVFCPRVIPCIPIVSGSVCPVHSSTCTDSTDLTQLFNREDPRDGVVWPRDACPVQR